MAGNTKKKGIKAGLLFWFIFAVIIAVAFLLARGKISMVLNETGFFEEVIGEKSDVLSGLLKQEAKKADTVIDIVPDTKETSAIDLNTTVKNQTDTIPESVNKPNDPAPVLPPVVKTESDLTLAKTDKTGTQETGKTSSKTKMLLYFVVIEGDGSVVRKEITREIDKTQTPLTTALKALLQGPSITELEKGTMSLIPSGTKLLSASITDKTAFLNFSEEFIYNTYGVEGYLGQLMQIVYTATSFSSIESVQFLINGQKENYLGGEGVWIGSPLPRSSFK